jgi:hypothetical protein
MPATISGSQTGTVGLINAFTSQTMSGATTVTFATIPSGVKRVTLMMESVTLNGATQPRVQVGYGGGTIVNSNYLGVTAAQITGTSASALSAGFDIQSTFANATNVFTGTYILNNLTGNVWTCTGQMSVLTGTTALAIINGRVSMAGALDRIVITTVSGTNTFLTGTMNVLYE